MLTLKYGRDIVDGDVLMIAEGNTVPFAMPAQPAQVVDRWMIDQGRIRLFTMKFQTAKERQEYIVWVGELYFVWVKDQEVIDQRPQ